MEYGEELNINYDAIEELYNNAEFLKHEMQIIMNHRHHHKKIKAQAVVLHCVCDTIVTFTMRWSDNERKWDTFIVELMGCCYLFFCIYNTMRVEFYDVFKACYNSDELRDAFNWMVKVLSKSTETVMLKDRYTWVDGK